MRGKKKKQKYKGQNVQLPPNWVTVRRQYHLRVGDNRDRVADVLNYLINNAPDSGKLPAYDQILSYGCWCQLFSSLWTHHSAKKGTPVDHLDAACRSWSKCHECIRMDYSECDPLTDDYGKLAYNTHLDYISCQFAANEGTCGRSACECDVRLANSLYEFSYDFQQENTEMNYFDPAQQCKSSGLADGQAMMVDQCCGTSPNRFPYFSDNGKRACCNGKTYDAENLVCCSHGPAVTC